ncbi:hypothetical protein E2320_022560, partial [Naja naja]
MYADKAAHVNTITLNEKDEAAEWLEACPKSPSEWPGSTSIQRMERDLLGQATLPDPLIDWPLTATRESRAMILEWRAATGPIGPMGDHNEPTEWQYQTEVCSQTFEDLPDQLEQLNILLPEEGDLPLWETFHQHIVHLQEWAWGVSRRGSPQRIHRGTSPPPPRLPPADQIPPGWAFYPGRGWVREQAEMMPAQAAAPPPPTPLPPQPAPCANAPTPFKTMFDGTARWTTRSDSTGIAVLRDNQKGNSHDAHFHTKGKDIKQQRPPTSIKCFRCGQQGHRASECLAPAPVSPGRAPAPPNGKRHLENLLKI